MQPTAPNVIVPFVPRFLRAQTRAAVPDARFIDVSADHRAYWRLLHDLWTESERFIIVEHDIVPTPEMIESLWNCPSDWCAHPYRMDDIVTTAFGLVAFGPRLLRGTSDLLERILDQHRVWSGLDSVVIAELHRRGYAEHVHEPEVVHLHQPAPPPQTRRRILTKLHYIGKGRYINGVPASDFETDDPVLVAVCLESGLYVDAATLRRGRRDVLTKFIPAIPEVVESAPEPIQSE